MLSKELVIDVQLEKLAQKFLKVALLRRLYAPSEDIETRFIKDFTLLVFVWV
jgi:hypothetical protein